MRKRGKSEEEIEKMFAKTLWERNAKASGEDHCSTLPKITSADEDEFMSSMSSSSLPGDELANNTLPDISAIKMEGDDAYTKKERMKAGK